MNLDDLEAAELDLTQARLEWDSDPHYSLKDETVKTILEAFALVRAPEEKKTPWVVMDARAQVMRCDRCSQTHPLADGFNGRPIWFATGVMNGFIKEHAECESDGT